MKTVIKRPVSESPASEPSGNQELGHHIVRPHVHFANKVLLLPSFLLPLLSILQELC